MYSGPFSGVYPAMATPFKDDGLDIPALERFAASLNDGGVNGLVVLGTTGEAATQRLDEQRRVVATVRRVVGEGMPLIIGAGSSCTAETIEKFNALADSGADAFLTSSPPYNKPTQEGLYQHFMALADASPLPLMLYNIPSRAGVNLLPATVARLAGHDRIVAIKEASGSITQMTETVVAADGRMDVLSGDDILFFPSLAVGLTGVVSVVANFMPRTLTELHRLWLAGDVAAARAIHLHLLPLMQHLFIESNPQPLKFVLSELGFMANELRLPMTSIQPETARILVGDLRTLRLLPGVMA